MKKISVLIIFIGLFLSQAFSQEKKDTSKPELTLSAWGGASFALKDFIVTFPDLVKGEQPNYAKTGESADIFFKVSDIPKVTTHVGFGLLCGYTYNSFDVKSYEQNQAMFYPNGLSNIPSSGYQMFRILPGLILSYGKKLSFNFRIMGGVLFLKTPIMGYTGTISTYPYYIDKVESQNGASLAYDLGIGMKYTLSPKISMLINADYFHCAPKVNTDYFFRISEITVTLGVGYTF